MTYDAARSTEDLGGQVGGELGLGDARVAVRARDTAPDDADTRAVDLTLGLVDVGDALFDQYCLSLLLGCDPRSFPLVILPLMPRGLYAETVLGILQIPTSSVSTNDPVEASEASEPRGVASPCMPPRYTPGPASKPIHSNRIGLSCP